MATTKRELFDAAEFDANMEKMLEKIRQQKPGVVVGLLGKKELLKSKRAELQKLMDDGYTISQIVDAMKNDVFSILPKTITEVLAKETKKPRVVKKVVDAVKTTPGTEATTVATTESTPATTVVGTEQFKKKQVTQIGDAE
uniref:Uncharacterized protein n=1 Tax=Polaromonas sp. W10N TaxID=1840301 RepID=A0A2S1FIH4_9BURK|nr:hypothetical protein [Polaromonas sp. W10N]AWD72318.1 hypothetical protein pW10NP1_p011 [Polaromonas sp. W10N]